MSKVVVGMSGGVDSSVCAFLLKEKGYDVIGVHLKMWPGEIVGGSDNKTGVTNGESAPDNCADAEKIAKKLGVGFRTYQLTDKFREKVVEPFCNKYLKGYTPNPCIECNRYLKWGAMLDIADELKAEYIATGHYAKLVKANERYTIQQADFLNKDQSYVLYQLKQEQLARTLFPLGEYSKDEVRKIAKSIGFEVADKKDSQDICFIPDGDYASFIERNVEADSLPQAGDFIDANGNVLGKHKGYFRYTYGQRKGLGIALGKPVFVTDIDTANNTVTLGDNEDCFSNELTAGNICHMGVERFDENETYIARIRYSHAGTECKVKYDGDLLVVNFLDNVRAVTPGQAVVLYKDGMVAGGGTIMSGGDTVISNP